MDGRSPQNRQKTKERMFHKIGGLQKKVLKATGIVFFQRLPPLPQIKRQISCINLLKRQLVQNCVRSDICSDMRSNEGRTVIKEPVKERYRHHHHLWHAYHYHHHLPRRDHPHHYLCHDHHHLSHLHHDARQWRANSDRGEETVKEESAIAERRRKHSPV